MEKTKTNILATLTDNGYIVSQQRRIIIDQLCIAHNIHSVEDFWLSLRQQHNISWATVHNTIRLLEHLGCIVKVRVGDGSLEYTLRPPSKGLNTDCI